MSDFNDLMATVDQAIFAALGESAIYNTATLVQVVIDKAVPYSDEDGQVFSTVDEVHIIEQDGLTIENGNTLETDTKTYKIQRFLRQSGKIKTYEIA